MVYLYTKWTIERLLSAMITEIIVVSKQTLVNLKKLSKKKISISRTALRGFLLKNSLFPFGIFGTHNASKKKTSTPPHRKKTAKKATLHKVKKNRVKVFVPPRSSGIASTRAEQQYTMRCREAKKK